MQVYLVGGAVRDRLLGREVRERDWVVVGATPAELERLGYIPVGRDFPVFLHPVTKEEHALARLERKVAPGYRGFTTEFSPDVTLEDDLRAARPDHQRHGRRFHPAMSSIPTAGCAISQARRLRHVSEAFAEDPVRILRVARFAARYAPLGFTVADETLALMRRMVEAGEAQALVAERVWAETEKALGEPRPDVFISVLRECGALQVVYPELDALFGVPQPEKWHPEIDTGVHQLLALREAVKLGGGVAVRFAVLMHDLGKGVTPAEVLPSHHGHEDAGVALVEQLADAAARPEPAARAGGDHRALPHPRASRPRVARRYRAQDARGLRRAAPTGTVRRHVAGLRGGCARSQGSRGTRLSTTATSLPRRASARHPWC